MTGYYSDDDQEGIEGFKPVAAGNKSDAVGNAADESGKNSQHSSVSSDESGSGVFRGVKREHVLIELDEDTYPHPEWCSCDRCTY